LSLGFSFAKRVRDQLPVSHCVRLFFLPRGLGPVARAAHRAQPSDPPSRATEQAQTGVWTLAVPRPRCALARPAFPPAGLAVRCPHVPASWLPPPARRISPPPSRSRESLLRRFGERRILAWLRLPSQHREGGSIRRSRGWQISPKPAGTGCASRVGETVAQPLANAEGPRRGSHPPVAGEGVCGRCGWGDARPHPATRGTGRRDLRGAESNRGLRTRRAKQRPLRSDKEETGSKPVGQRKARAAKRQNLLRTGGGATATRVGVPAPRVR